MEEPAESRVIRKFRQRLERGELTENVKLMYRVEGGMPSQRLEEELRLSGRGRAYARRLDVLQSISDEQVAADLDPDEVVGLLREFESMLDRLASRSEASFGPDCVIGSITIEVDGEQARLYFDPGEPEKGRLAELAMLSTESGQARQEQALGVQAELTQARQEQWAGVSAELDLAPLEQAAITAAAPVRRTVQRVRTVSADLFERRKEQGNG